MVRKTQSIKGKNSTFLAFSHPDWFLPYMLFCVINALFSTVDIFLFYFSSFLLVNGYFFSISLFSIILFNFLTFYTAPPLYYSILKCFYVLTFLPLHLSTVCILNCSTYLCTSVLLSLSIYCLQFYFSTYHLKNI